MKNNASFLTKNRGILIFFAVMLLAPFVIGLFEGSTPLMIWNNQGSFSKFLEGLGIEIFILALFALSFDLLFGITGLLSFGHAMFFAVAAYLTGIALKTLAMPFWGVVLLVLLAAIVQALLFSMVLPRVKGITFTLVSLGLASVFHIIVMSSDMINLTGADVGLQGVPVPAFISPVTERLRFYVIALTLLVAAYLFYRRFVASPTGRVCVAIRENEDRAKMLGYNTTIFKVVVMIISSLTAATAGMLHALYQPSISIHSRFGVYCDRFADCADWRRWDAQRRDCWRVCVSVAGFYPEAVYGGIGELHHRRYLRHFRPFRSLWDCRDDAHAAVAYKTRLAAPFGDGEA